MGVVVGIIVQKYSFPPHSVPRRNICPPLDFEIHHVTCFDRSESEWQCTPETRPKRPFMLLLALFHFCHHQEVNIPSLACYFQKESKVQVSWSLAHQPMDEQAQLTSAWPPSPVQLTSRRQVSYINAHCFFNSKEFWIFLLHIIQ